MGKPVLMGRKTYLSIGKPLPGRTNIVVSRDPGFAPAGRAWSRRASTPRWTRRATTREQRGADEIVVIGGTGLFEQTMPLADRMEITHVHAQPGGRHVFSADRCGTMARGCAQRSSGRTAGRGRRSATSPTPGLELPNRRESRVRPARCPMPAACVVRRGRLPYNPHQQTDRRRCAGRRGEISCHGAIRAAGPGDRAAARALGAPGRNRPGRRRPTSRICCGAARTSSGACCRAATWAAAASR